MQNEIKLSSNCACSQKGKESSSNSEIKKAPCKGNCPNCASKKKNEK